VLGLGIATRYVPATTAMLWFTGVLLAVLAGIGVAARTNRRDQKAGR
jgi:cytochrome c-type biogenesis protein CcmH/NrfF